MSAYITKRDISKIEDVKAREELENLRQKKIAYQTRYRNKVKGLKYRCSISSFEDVDILLKESKRLKRDVKDVRTKIDGSSSVIILTFFSVNTLESLKEMIDGCLNQNMSIECISATAED